MGWWGGGGGAAPNNKTSTKIILKKRINDKKHKYSTVYFNSSVKTVISQRYYLNDLFEEILDLLDI